jgi:PPP family 3-phenylpropionic acid transporter
MSSYPKISTVRAFAVRLAIFYAALFAALGVQLPFLPVWLAAKGLGAEAIGIVLAVPMVVRLLAIPLAAGWADRRDALRATLGMAAAGSFLGYAVLALAPGPAAIVACFALASACYTPLMPLADSYALRGLGGRAYGPVRLWGSLAFIAGSFTAGLLSDIVAADALIWLIVSAMLLTAAAAGLLAPFESSSTAAAAVKSSPRLLLRDPGFLCIAGAASLIQASHAVYYGFSSLEWRAAGFGGCAVGALWALGVAAEIVLFAVSGRLAVAPARLLLAGAAGATIRWCAMALTLPPALLPVLQCLHALSFGATHLGAVGFIARAAPAEIGASAQGYLAVALGAVMAAAMGASGLLYAGGAGLAYGVMAAAAAAGGVLALIAARLGVERSL